MKFLVVGCGSVGKRHIKNLKKLGIKQIIVYDKRKKILEELKKARQVIIAKDFKKAIKDADAVLICTPNNSHVKLALESIENNCHVFIEKPLSNNLVGVDKLIKLAKNKKLVIQIGYNLRFHPLLIEIKNLLKKKTIGNLISAHIEFGYYLPYWHPKEDYSKSYSANKRLGGGIILDASHEIDYACWFFGKAKKLSCSHGKLSDLKIDTEDTAEIVIKFENNVIANLHLDYLQRNYTRFFKIIGKKGIIIGDLKKNTIKVFKNGKWKERKITFNYDYTYVNEIKHFIDCIKQNKKPVVDLETAAYVLKLALLAKKQDHLNV